MSAPPPAANPTSISDAHAAIASIEKAAAENQPRLSLWGWAWKSSFDPIEVLVDRFLSDRIAGLPNKAELISNIKTRRDKIPLSASVTAPIVGICQQVLAFGAAGIALTVGFIDKFRQFEPVVQKVLTAVGIFYVELIILSLFVLLFFMLQARFRYPSIYFEKIGNAWPFFYYASIGPVSRNPLQGPRARFDASVNYAKDFIAFSERVFQENEDERLRVELQQYFLLLSYQAYVNQFGIRLTRLFMYGFIAATATMTVMVILILVGVL